MIASIGQGYVTVTPLQLARAYAALANGGTLYSPRIGEELVSPAGKVVRKITPPVVGHLPVAKSTLAYIRNALGGRGHPGHRRSARSAGSRSSKVCVAGKTGTAQVQGKLATSVFASFAPCEHPKYVVVMMIPDSGYGADVSAPAVRQIWDGIYGLEGHKAALPDGELPPVPHVGQSLPAGAAGRASAGAAGAVFPTSDAGATKERRRSEEGRQRLASGGRSEPESTAWGRGNGMSQSRPSGRGLLARPPLIGSKPPSGPFPAPRLAAGPGRGWLRTMLGRDSQLRHLDWVLLAAVLSLGLIGHAAGLVGDPARAARMQAATRTAT